MSYFTIKNLIIIKVANSLFTQEIIAFLKFNLTNLLELNFIFTITIIIIMNLVVILAFRMQ